ncbi:Aste57867_16642 [Aphanomyces stellatus]|uniref:Aste57867_16642 protein n=1 Tax=Aphanomyces stellatus TaxID=120398 RepID=A0A485L7I1_9STRA|nr:hypothetical protein As57867_016585 [Aphanomyces stellatus]VFT93413.1 Aste57867_16642 [Aphanomyces stellatus]
MRVTYPIVALAVHTVAAFDLTSLPFDINDVINWLAGAINKLSLPIIEQYIDKKVLAALNETAKIQRTPLAVRQTATGAAFRILQIPDLHYTGNPNKDCLNKPDGMKECHESHMSEMIAKMCETLKPDFVVFTGDQLEGQYSPQTWANSYKTIDMYSAELNKRSIPWSMVFGNHDESIAPHLFTNKKLMMAYIESLPMSYAKFGPYNIGGAGNYELAVQGLNNTTAMRMYYMDTHRDGNVTPEQINYAKQMAAGHKGENVPALMFFHIPIPEYKEGAVLQGERNEGWVSSFQNGIYDTMVQMGDVKASFCGHNHLDDYCSKKGNISLCISGSSGYGLAYGKSNFSRTARVIEWTKDAAQESINTWLYLHNSGESADHLSVYQA